MKIRIIILAVLLSFTYGKLSSQTVDQKPVERKHFIGSTLFMVLTPILDPSPKYYQLNYGYRLTPKDIISIEAITWTYQGPLGRPYGPDYEQASSSFPGEVQAIGGGLAYQRFLWKGVFGQIQSTAFRQNYLDMNGKKIQSGFQLFNTLQPSIAVTNWPINTNLPESFQIEEDKWPNYFLFEPGLQFGFNF